MKKILIIAIVLAGLAILVLAVNQWISLRRAHSTFENYYAFRGCSELLEKTDTYGICRTNAGQTIKIVEYQNKWYLDGDLPWACVGKMCFGM